MARVLHHSSAPSTERETSMDTGIDFLRSQVNNAVMQHDTLLRSLVDHESQAQDQRFRDLCSRHIPRMREHQRMLEEFQRALGTDNRDNNPLENIGGTIKRVAGSALGMAKDLADAPRQSDYLRLVSDIVMARQAEDTFKTFREGGRQLGIQQLAQIGETGERHHDEYVKEANRLVQQMFVEHARGAEQLITATTNRQFDIGAM
jgi:hypothetical protein